MTGPEDACETAERMRTWADGIGKWSTTFQREAVYPYVIGATNRFESGYLELHTRMRQWRFTAIAALSTLAGLLLGALVF